MKGMKIPPCPVHRVPLVERHGKFGTFWSCPHWPDCDIMATLTRQGQRLRPSDGPTREARKRAHDIFDLLWHSGQRTRGKCYRWLQEAMGLSSSKCHIGEFTIEQCEQVIELATERLGKIGV